MTDKPSGAFVLRARVPTGLMFGVAIVAAILGAWMQIAWRTQAYPADADLERIDGQVAWKEVRDNIAGAPAIEDAIPGMTTVMFRLAGNPLDFRYPAGRPLYFVVRDGLGGEASVWVERAALEAGAPAVVWALSWTSPAQAVEIPREWVVATLQEVDRSMAAAGRWLVAIAGLLAASAWLTVRWRARREAPPEPSEDGVPARLRRFLSNRVLGAAATIEHVYLSGERLSGVLLGEVLGPGLWNMLCVGVYAVATLAVAIALSGLLMG